MDVATQLDYFRKEHNDILHFLEEWARALDLVTSRDDERRLRGLNELRAIEPDLLAVRDHCSAEERSVEVPYRSYLEKSQLEKLTSEHQEIGKLVQDILVELRFATVDQIEGIRNSGRQLSSVIRDHIAYEEKLLMEIEQGLATEAEEKLLLRFTQSPE